MNNDSRRSFLKSCIAFTSVTVMPAGAAVNGIRNSEYGSSSSSHFLDRFFAAIREGELATVRDLLSSDKSLLHARNQQGLSGYCLAKLEGRREIADFLLKAGYECDLHEAAIGLDWSRFEAVAESLGDEVSERVNLDHPLGGNAMYAAASGGAGTNIWRVYAQGGDPNRHASSNRMTPLQKALRFQNFETAELTAFTLLSNNADPAATLAGDLSPLSIAAERGSYDIVEMLIRLGAKVDFQERDGRTSLEVAESEGHQRVVELLASHQEIDRTISTFRYAANREGDPCEVVNWQGISRIKQSKFVGACHGNIAEVKRQLANDKRLAASVATTSEAAVEAGAHMGNKPIVELLLDAGAPYALPTAVMMGDMDSVSKNLDENPERIHARGAHDFALLWYPIIGQCDLAMTKLLLERGAHVEAQSQMGTTALHWACMRGENLELIELLLENGANPNRVGRKFGGKPLTPLQMAKAPAVRKLLESKGAKSS